MEFMNDHIDIPDSVQAVMQGLREAESVVPLAEDWRLAVARFYNCREQGYTVMLRDYAKGTLNISFFQHRNSDDLCAWRWVAPDQEVPRIEDIPEDVAPNKWTHNFCGSGSEPGALVDYIVEELRNRWEKLST